ncbi:MAG: GIY-YIG nuclease family protein [bacterium]|nr:GIY-YIG nuclease family protein [bacterium]MDO8496393.1 GIY-YIG nuclease family protein [bacterium]
MFYFYVLKSTKDNELYFGYTEDLKNRLSQHNSGKVPSTRLKKPLILIYYEAYRSQSDAKHREYSIKLRGNAYLQLKRRIKNCVAEAE